MDPQNISFEHDEETDRFHLFLNGEDQGPVDSDSLREEVGDLHVHFHMFRDHTEASDFDAENDSELDEEELDDLVREAVEE